MAATPPISILDLTMLQVANIEKRIGRPLTRWRDEGSLAQVYVEVIVETGVDRQTAEGMTLRDLASRVDLSGDEPEDPTPDA